eukprot:TRINITY_DN2312_c0_g1_i1.p1 TRINITY_DN2312_c0_g1~~TRINITY_DN2312_c0_g1_i1.p1  ORF type:complete len:525 (+),score=14.57 TRINITY_DN2312_c0_g1_i1:20-1594(+)
MRFLFSSLIALCVLQLVLSTTCPPPTVCPRGEDYECGSTSTNACCNGTCVPLVALGASCNAECEGRCVAGAACIRGTCLLSPYGCSCTSDSDCAADMSCQNSTCRDRPRCNRVGETSECPSDQICWKSECQVGLPLNSACLVVNQGSQCGVGSYCGIDSTCQPNPKINETCSNNCETGLYCSPSGRCVSRMANGSTCMRDDNCQSDICLTYVNICSPPLNLGETCFAADECASEICECPGYNGTETASQCTRQCTNDYHSLVDGSYCSSHDQCQSQFCLCLDGSSLYNDCKMARCSPQFTVEEGGNCTDSSQCQTFFCNEGTCVGIRSIPIGGACEDSDVCPFGADCDNGVCVDLLNQPCQQDGDCGNSQECTCQGTGAGICTNSSSWTDALDTLKCLQDKKAWSAMICLESVKNGLESLTASCQASIADYMCCASCNRATVDSDLTWISGYTVDCRSRTITPSGKQPCCGATSKDCWTSNILNCDAFSTGTIPSTSTSSTSDESSASQMAWISISWLSVSILL